MNILHYALGLPPYRSGGLTKYASDLMLAQNTNGDTVSLLYPGDYTFWLSTKIRIEKDNNFNGVSVYEIVNPSPVPLLYGVRKPADIYGQRQKLSKKALEQFYNEIKPEVMHIHTLMGLIPELVTYLKVKGVKIIFTSHDYYGLCPKVNFINHNGELCDSPSGKNCALCNMDAPNSLFLRLRNSKYLLKHKAKLSSGVIKTAITNNADKLAKIVYPSQELCAEYSALLEHYQKLFALVDCFHFNSSVSKQVYDRYLVTKQSVVLPISHGGIKDARKLKKFDKKHLHMAFIGGTSAYKGFPMLKEVLGKLNRNGFFNWSLQVWGSITGLDKECDKIIYRGTYLSDDLASVFNSIDLLIVPSVWKETFSLITLEALSFGVPALVSNNLGAKDLVAQYNPDFVFYPSEEILYSKLKAILKNPMLLEDYNIKICEGVFEYLIHDHAKQIRKLYID